MKFLQWLRSGSSTDLTTTETKSKVRRREAVKLQPNIPEASSSTFCQELVAAESCFFSFFFSFVADLRSVLLVDLRPLALAADDLDLATSRAIVIDGSFTFACNFDTKNLYC